MPIPGTRPRQSLVDRHNLRGVLDFAHMTEDLGADDVALSEHVVVAHRPDKYGPGSAPNALEMRTRSASLFSSRWQRGWGWT